MTLASRVRAGDRRAAARLIRLADDGDPSAMEALAELYRASTPAQLAGITGSPGSGKSTLIDGLIGAYRGRGERVGVVAIDPTSPFTGGAILGDRVRMQRHTLDVGVFVRSHASRGQLGGLSWSVPSTIAVMEAMGLGRVIVETVGIGQAEIDVARIADTTVVVVAPGLGDDVQALKAGLMEIADVFAVNKADRPGVDRTTREIEQVLELRGPDPSGWTPPVVRTTAKDGAGILDLVEAIDRHGEHLVQAGLQAARREARARLEIETALLAGLRAEMLARVGGEGALLEAARSVASRSSDARAECQRLLGTRKPG